MKDDDRLDELLREAAQDDAPPLSMEEREAMWAEISLRRRVVPFSRSASPGWTRWIGVAAAAAATLAIGFTVGRLSAPPPAGPDSTQVAGRTGESAGVTPPAASGLRAAAARARPSAYRLAAGATLGRAESLLTEYQTGPASAMEQAKLEAWARDLLAESRLLIDSPAGSDPELKPLLLDLEQVLVQIVQHAGSGRPGERERIVNGMDNRGVLLRLRTWMPAGTVTGS